jgi:hypothetical protein
MFCHNLTRILSSAGNGPITNVAPFVGTAGAIVLVTDSLGGAVVRRAIVDASGIWEVYDLTPGRYFATEIGSSRQWQIDVAADLSFTVTPITSSFPVNVSSGYVA